MTHYKLFVEEVEAIIQDWPEEWRVPIVDDQLSANKEEWQDDPQTQKDGGQGENPLEKNTDNTQNE